MKHHVVHNCCSKKAVKRGFWSPEEDMKLITYITTHGHGCWSSLSERAGLQRCGKSCRLRWMNYLRPGIKRGNFSTEEENVIISLQARLNNRWAQIAKHLPGRTDTEIKNYWHSCLKKKAVAAANQGASQQPPIAMILDQIAIDDVDMDPAPEIDLYGDSGAGCSQILTPTITPEVADWGNFEQNCDQFSANFYKATMNEDLDRYGEASLDFPLVGDRNSCCSVNVANQNWQPVDSGYVSLSPSPCSLLNQRNPGESTLFDQIQAALMMLSEDFGSEIRPH